MTTYGINLIMKRNAGTITSTNYVPIAADKNGALETRDSKEAEAALDYWSSNYPQHAYELVKIERTTLEIRPEKKGNE